MATDAGIKDKNFATDTTICGNAACSVAGKLDDVGTSAVVGLAIGNRLPNNMRVELSYGYRGGFALDDKDVPLTAFKADITSHAVLANVYWDFGASRRGMAPYLGFGLGWARNTVGTISATDTAGTISRAPGGTDSGLAWQLSAGIGWPVSPTAVFDLGYRYFSAGNIETEVGNVTQGGATVSTYQGAEGILSAHEIIAAIRFGF